eukprot:364930-Chlamydomonas_euryale.AAC.32
MPAEIIFVPKRCAPSGTKTLGIFLIRVESSWQAVGPASHRSCQAILTPSLASTRASSAPSRPSSKSMPESGARQQSAVSKHCSPAIRNEPTLLFCSPASCTAIPEERMPDEADKAAFTHASSLLCSNLADTAESMDRCVGKRGGMRRKL